MAKIFKPRRALKATMSGDKKNTVLSAGEMMVVSLENSETGTIGGINKCNIYIGDGTRKFSQLKPSLYGDTSEEPISITESVAQTTEAALAEVVNGKKLSQLIGSLKTAVEKISVDPQTDSWHIIPKNSAFTNEIKSSDSTGYSNIPIKKDTEGTVLTNPTYNKYYIDLSALLEGLLDPVPTYSTIIIKATIPVATRNETTGQEFHFQIVCPITLEGVMLNNISVSTKQSFRNGYFQEKGGSDTNGFGIETAFYVNQSRIYFDRAYLNGHQLPISDDVGRSMGLIGGTDLHWKVFLKGGKGI